MDNGWLFDNWWDTEYHGGRTHARPDGKVIPYYVTTCNLFLIQKWPKSPQ